MQAIQLMPCEACQQTMLSLGQKCPKHGGNNLGAKVSKRFGKEFRKYTQSQTDTNLEQIISSEVLSIWRGQDVWIKTIPTDKDCD